MYTRTWASGRARVRASCAHSHSYGVGPVRRSVLCAHTLVTYGYVPVLSRILSTVQRTGTVYIILYIAITGTADTYYKYGIYK